MGHTQYSFPKRERLSSKKKIEELFKTGSSFYWASFQVRYAPVKAPTEPCQILISVPKKKFKRAVDRNLIRRRIREAYRLNKQCLAEAKPHYLAFVYLSKEILPFQTIQHQLIACLDRFKSNTQ